MLFASLTNDMQAKPGYFLRTLSWHNVNSLSNYNFTFVDKCQNEVPFPIRRIPVQILSIRPDLVGLFITNIFIIVFLIQL